MISGKQNILGYFDQVAKPYFKVYKLGTVQSGNAIYESPEEENYNFDLGRADFQKWLNFQSTGRFTLVISSSPNFPSKGKFISDFEVLFSESTAPAPIQQAPVIAGFPAAPVDVEAQVAKKAGELFSTHILQWENGKLKEEVADLKKEIKSLEKEGGNGSGFIEKVLPHVAGWMEKMGGTPSVPAVGKATALVAGTEIPDAYGDEDISDRLIALGQRFARHDAHWLDLLEKMATKLDENPNLISTFKMFI